MSIIIRRNIRFKHKIRVNRVIRKEFFNMSNKKIRVKKATSNNHHSVWNLTVSTNKTDVLDNRKNFQKAIDYIFQDTSLIENWITFRQGSWDDIKEFDIQHPVIEIAPTTGYIHFHCVINITHQCRIILNKAQIDKDFKDQLGYSVYSHFRLIPNYQKQLEDYAIKSMN